jgi:hypothetical protein
VEEVEEVEEGAISSFGLRETIVTAVNTLSQANTPHTRGCGLDNRYPPP